MEEYQGLVSQPLDSEDCGTLTFVAFPQASQTQLLRSRFTLAPPLPLLLLRSDQMKPGVSTKM